MGRGREGREKRGEGEERGKGRKERGSDCPPPF